MSKHTIEKGIPLYTNAGRPEKYAVFRAMEVGDSVAIKAPAATVVASTYKYGKELGSKFAVRTEGKGCRVWRVK